MEIYIKKCSITCVIKSRLPFLNNLFSKKLPRYNPLHLILNNSCYFQNNVNFIQKMVIIPKGINLFVHLQQHRTIPKLLSEIHSSAVEQGLISRQI